MTTLSPLSSVCSRSSKLTVAGATGCRLPVCRVLESRVRERERRREISRVLSPADRGPRRGHLSGTCGFPRPRAAYPELERDGPPLVPAWPCSRRGLPCRPCHQETRWALTPPFHPCLCGRSRHRRSALCGTFHRLATPGRYPAPCPVEPGLSSNGVTCTRPRPLLPPPGGNLAPAPGSRSPRRTSASRCRVGLDPTNCLFLGSIGCVAGSGRSLGQGVRFHRRKSERT